jgi:3-oxoacyl-[acyl-carrier protein] reductase
MDRPAALISGVGRPIGIGAGIARTLSALGWNLALTYWPAYDQRMPWGAQPDELHALKEELAISGVRIVALPVDLEDPDEAAKVVRAAVAEVGPLSGLILSHCESVASGILDTSLESFERHFAVNTRASWQLIREFALQVPPSGGSIVALTSDATVSNMPYGASKGAMDRIVLAAARELAHLHIRANVINPGPVDTGWMDDATRRAVTTRQPTGTLGTPRNTANLVAFLMSPEGAWINGQLLKSDGGFSA